MENFKLQEVQNNITGELETFVIIDMGNGNSISMLKSYYDTLPSNSSIPQAGE